MAEPINLNRARKARVRKDAEAAAAQNRVKFGRTKAERLLAEAREAQAASRLDASKREP